MIRVFILLFWLAGCVSPALDTTEWGEREVFGAILADLGPTGTGVVHVVEPRVHSTRTPTDEEPDMLVLGGDSATVATREDVARGLGFRVVGDREPPCLEGLCDPVVVYAFGEVRETDDGSMAASFRAGDGVGITLGTVTVTESAGGILVVTWKRGLAIG
jgi:hypothetical protein